MGAKGDKRMRTRIIVSGILAKDCLETWLPLHSVGYMPRIGDILICIFSSKKGVKWNTIIPPLGWSKADKDNESGSIVFDHVVVMETKLFAVNFLFESLKNDLHYTVLAVT